MVIRSTTQRGCYIVVANQHAAEPKDSGATSFVSASRRELIARYAAKTAGLDGAYAERYVSSVRNQIVLWNRRPQASGIERAVEWGFRLRFLREAQGSLLFIALSAVAAILVPHFWIQSLFIAVLGILVAGAAGFASFWNWRERHRTVWSTMLPEAGTSIGADSKCLTVGATSVPWSDLRLEAVELRGVRAFSVVLPQTYRVDQLRLATGKGSLVLDVCLVKNGQEIVDTICDKLEVPSVAASHQRA